MMWYSTVEMRPMISGFTGSDSRQSKILPLKVDPGWDDAGTKLYQDQVFKLAETGIMTTSIYSPGPVGEDDRVQPFYVSKSEAGFWSKLKNGGWERQTFHIFNQYINPGKTKLLSQK
ncbi:hypothetical protein ACHAWC_000291 [Mediolabrus comicus]